MFNLIRQSQASRLKMKDGKDSQETTHTEKGGEFCAVETRGNSLTMFNNNISVFDSDEFFVFSINKLSLLSVFLYFF